MNPENAQERILGKLRSARQERQDGNEGRARVCARIAAGWAAGQLYRRRAPAEKVPSTAMALPLWFRGLEIVPPELREATNRLTRHVRSDHTLPYAEDPLEDAERIARAVLGGEIE